MKKILALLLLCAFATANLSDTVHLGDGAHGTNPTPPDTVSGDGEGGIIDSDGHSGELVGDEILDGAGGDEVYEGSDRLLFFPGKWFYKWTVTYDHLGLVTHIEKEVTLWIDWNGDGKMNDDTDTGVCGGNYY